VFADLPKVAAALTPCRASFLFMKRVIQARGLGKQYRRGLRIETGLRHVLERLVRSPLSMFRSAQGEAFWALRNVDLDVSEGEVLGLVGRNGAGKTTLLKILSRITRPTAGWAEIHGHVRSLLEVGTGFHGELTGRENTYFSGSILGMKKREIDRKLDEIVAFAEIEKFIDTPVKHYSSGMYVRLAFAVAAHLEPEILLVDEVLAVGDINFQKKCLGKMGDAARQGRTVVLVSHQMNQMRRFCNRVVWIDGGSIQMTGGAHETVSAYEAAMSKGDRLEQGRGKSVDGRFVTWRIMNQPSGDPHVITELNPVTIEFTVEITRTVLRGHHGCALFTHDRQLVWAWAAEALRLDVGKHRLCYTFPMLPLRPGSYSWQVSLYEDGRQLDAWECLPEMMVATAGYQHTRDEWNGILNLPFQFQAEADWEGAS
jgi:lipopolysaccharide transport system ATP-binding protein